MSEEHPHRSELETTLQGWARADVTQVTKQWRHPSHRCRVHVTLCPSCAQEQPSTLAAQVAGGKALAGQPPAHVSHQQHMTADRVQRVTLLGKALPKTLDIRHQRPG